MKTDIYDVIGWGLVLSFGLMFMYMFWPTSRLAPDTSLRPKWNPVYQESF